MTTTDNASDLVSVRVVGTGYVASYSFVAPDEQITVQHVPASVVESTDTERARRGALMAEGYRELADEMLLISEEAIWATSEVLPDESE